MDTKEEVRGKVLFLVKDIIFRAKIKEALTESQVNYTFVRDESGLSEKMKGEEFKTIVLDLNLLGEKIGDFIKEVKALGKDAFVLGFFSHVNKEQSEAAVNAGIDMVLPRSKFFGDVNTYIAKKIQ